MSLKDIQTEQPIAPDHVSYAWQFESNGQLVYLDAVSGDLAAELTQTRKPDEPQTAMLHVKTLSTSPHWTRGRCVAVVTRDPTEEGGAPTRKAYYSDFFTPGAAINPDWKPKYIAVGKTTIQKSVEFCISALCDALSASPASPKMNTITFLNNASYF